MGQVFNTYPASSSPTGVTAAAVIAANAVVIGDDGARGIKGSVVAIDNSGNVTGVVGLSASGQISTSFSGIASTPALFLTGTILTGATGTTNFPSFFIQPSGATAAANWNTAGTAFGMNLTSGWGGDYVNLQKAGASIFKIDTNASIIAGGGIQIAGTSAFLWASRGALSSPTAGSIQSGSGDAASPVAQTFRAQSVVAGTSNTAGQNWTVVGSLSTGSGTSGDIIFQTGGTGAGATAQNSATTALTIKGATQTVQVASGVALQLGNIRSAGVLVQGGSVTMLDSAGTTITVLTT